MSNATQMTTEELKAELEKRGESTIGELNVKIGPKKGIVVGGPNLLQRFPVSLYPSSWLVLLEDKNRNKILNFIEEHHTELSWGNHINPFENNE